MNPLINKANTFHFMEIVKLLQNLAYSTGDEMEILFNKSNYSNIICQVFKAGVRTYTMMAKECNSLPSNSTKELKEKAKKYVKKIKIYDPKYKSPIKWYM